jgi:hypothetical protein
VLTKLGKARGYLESPPPEPPAPKPVGVFDLSRLPPEERAEFERLEAIKRGQAPSGSAASAGVDAQSKAASAPPSTEAAAQAPGGGGPLSLPSPVTVPSSSSPTPSQKTESPGPTPVIQFELPRLIDLSRLTPAEQAERQRLLAIKNGQAPSGVAASPGVESQSSGPGMPGAESHQPVRIEPTANAEQASRTAPSDEAADARPHTFDPANLCGMPRSYFLNPRPVLFGPKVARAFALQKKKSMLPDNKQIRILPSEPKKPPPGPSPGSKGQPPPPEPK